MSIRLIQQRTRTCVNIYDKKKKVGSTTVTFKNIGVLKLNKPSRRSADVEPLYKRGFLYCINLQFIYFLNLEHCFRHKILQFIICNIVSKMNVIVINKLQEKYANARILDICIKSRVR